MDGLFNKGKEMLTKSGKTGEPAAGNAPAAGAGGQPAAGAGGQDYGDKGLAFLEKKTGHNFSAEQNEKITDGARGLYEKQTGSKVDAKYSN